MLEPLRSVDSRVMPDSRRLPLWAGRTTALAGIILVAVNLRTAVASVSPIATEIAADIDLGNLGLGLIGALPPVAFALSGLFGAGLARRIGLERLVVICTGVIVAGHLLRGSAGNYLMLLAGSVVTFAGIGIANILLPPLVKRYFPDRIGLLTTVYAAVMAISTAVPSALAAPIADSAGWRVSLGIWSVLAVLGLIPWMVLLLRYRRRRIAAALGSSSPEMEEPSAELVGRIRHSRTAWAIAGVFAVSSFGAYASFAWLPQLLIDRAGVTRIDAGSLLAIYSLIGLPSAIVIPVLVTRLRDVRPVIWTGAAAIVAGFLGLLLAPAGLTWLWVLLAGLGPLLFPVALVLINTRSRTEQGSVALSGFTQGVGYIGGALGPLLIGGLHEVTGGWELPIIAFLLTAVVAVIAAFFLRTPSFVEDEIAR